LQQGWGLDATGNWQDFTQFDLSGVTAPLDQQRVSNTANEITAIWLQPPQRASVDYAVCL
jgi:hypothetical protein